MSCPRYIPISDARYSFFDDLKKSQKKDWLYFFPAKKSDPQSMSCQKKETKNLFPFSYNWIELRKLKVIAGQQNISSCSMEWKGRKLNNHV